MSGNELDYWLCVCGLAALAGYSFWFACRSWVRNRVVADTPTSRVRSAAQGYVELCGRSLLPPDSHNRGPLTGMPCTWWRYKIEERGLNMRSRSWSTIDSGASEEPFLLDDGTGQCLIDPSGAEVFPSASNVWYGPEAWPQGCIPNGTGFLGWLADKLITDRYRYTEHRLLDRQPVYAIGAFRSLGGVSVDSPDGAVSELLRQWKKDQAGLLSRFDNNHDGMLSSAEWDLARAAALKQVVEARNTDIRPPSMNVLSEPGDGRAFLLAACDAASLARRFRYRTVAGIGGFVGSAGALTWILTRV